MDILLFSDRQCIQQVSHRYAKKHTDVQVSVHLFNELHSITHTSYDTIVMDFTKIPVDAHTLTRIFEVKNVFHAPVLAITSRASSREKLNLFHFGVEDYIELQYLDKQYEPKLDAAIRLKKLLDLYQEHS